MKDGVESAKNLWTKIKCANPDCEVKEIDDLIDDAEMYSDNKEAWFASIHINADRRDIEMPEEWWECVVETYTPRQKKFAEICREVIVPELKKLTERRIDETA